MLRDESQICLLRQELLRRQLTRFVPELSQEEIQLFLAASNNKFGFFLQKLPLATDFDPILDLSNFSETQQSLLFNKKSRWSAWKPYLSNISPTDTYLSSTGYKDWILAIAEEFPDHSELLKFARESAMQGTVHQTLIRDLMFFSNGGSTLGPTHQIETLPRLTLIRSETEFAKLHEIATFNIYRNYRDQQLARKISLKQKQSDKLRDEQRIAPPSSFGIKVVLQLLGLISTMSKRILKQALNKITNNGI